MIKYKSHAQASIDVIDERVRQVEQEAWDYTHDDQYVNGELLNAAVCYMYGTVEADWPFNLEDWKLKDTRQNLVRAAALIIAEIERLDRR